MLKACAVVACGALSFVAQVLGDPSVPGLLYSTTVVDSNTTYDSLTVSAVALDAAGNSYVVGRIQSAGLQATPGVFQPHYAGGLCPASIGGPYSPPRFNPCPDAFVSKFDAQGRLIFLTCLGGTGAEFTNAVAVDGAGNIYLGGPTTSKDFPLAGKPWRPVLQNAATSFLAKLSADGSSLLYSTVVNWTLTGMSALPDGTIYFIANTYNYADGYLSNLTKLNPDGSLVYNAAVPPQTQAIAVGSDGSVFIGGPASRAEVSATPGAWQSTFGGGSSDGFVARLGTDPSQFAWVTFLGGGDTDSVSSMQVDPTGAIWVGGTTLSSNFPTLANAWQPHANPAPARQPGFLVRLAADGSTALASTYTPGEPRSLSVDTAADVIITAENTTVFQATPGAQWPCVQPFADGLGHLTISTDRHLLAKLDPLGQKLLWGSWEGPSIPPGPAAADGAGNAVVAGVVQGDHNLTLAALITQPGVPRLVASCVNPAGYPYMPGPIAPGEILSIYGAGFGPQQGVSAQVVENRVGTQLAGVQVLVEGVPAPLLYLSAAQINLVAPYSIDGRTQAHVQIVSADTSSDVVVFPVAPAAPEIFESQPFFAAILNGDGSVNGPSHPAHPGNIVALFAAGAGQMVPPAADGEIAQTATRKPALPVRVHLRAGLTDTDADITYSGEAPTLVSGVLQVNFRVPVINAYGPGPYYVDLELDIGNPSGSAIRTLVVALY